MPIYEYKCNKCGVFEAMQGIKESPLKKCPTCNSKVERQMSRGSFILKGSGWYATDYAKKSTPSSTDADSTASTATPATNGSTASSNDSPAKSAGESKPASEIQIGVIGIEDVLALQILIRKISVSQIRRLNQQAFGRRSLRTRSVRQHPGQ